jgi:uncharacterized protein with HEPN domain
VRIRTAGLLIAIGESLKKIDALTNGQFLDRYPGIDWKKAKGLRDILSHHYFDLNAEAIYDVCKTKMPLMKQTIGKMLGDLESVDEKTK